MAYDFRRQVVVLYGGLMLHDQSYTWEWDGADWIAQDIAEPDPWRWAASMTYDPRRGATVLYGGENPLTFFGDTWERAGDSDWVQVFRARTPGLREHANFAYNPRLRGNVLYGGSERPNVFADDTWLWTGANWYRLPLESHPHGHCGGFAYDPVLRGMFLFIGCSAPGVLDSQTWLLRQTAQRQGKENAS